MPTDLGVGADGIRPKLYRGLGGPLAQRLRHQRDRRHQEQHRATGRHQVLGDPQRGERLARATRHDQLAPVGAGEVRAGRLQREELVRAQDLAVLTRHHLRGTQAELRPVHARVVQVLHPQPGDRNLLVVQRRLSVLAPRVRRRDDHATGEARRAGRGEERVDVALSQGVRRRVELALDRRQRTGGPLLGHQINPGVGLARPARPVHPQPHVAEPLRPHPVGA